jgi:hypothetical protein
VSSLAFNLDQLALMHKCLQRSEELVSRAFAIPALPSLQYPYEVATASDLAAHERATKALAHLVIYQRSRPRGLENLYRICLQDEVILNRLQTGSQVDGLSALLVYILTHELVHVVRFQRAEQSFSAKRGVRQQEEDLVHQLTLNLLRQAGASHWEYLDQCYGNPVIPAQRVQR